MSNLPKEIDLLNNDYPHNLNSQGVNINSKDCKEQDFRNSYQNPELDVKEEYLFPGMLSKTE